MRRIGSKKFFTKKNAFENEEACIPDHIFLNLNMTKIGGRKTKYLLKKDSGLKHIPVIMLTTVSDFKKKKELLRLGAIDFYTKPVDLPELIEIVKQVKLKWLS